MCSKLKVKSGSTKWFSLEDILKIDAQYYMIFGERSNGKSYAVCKYMIDKFYQNKEEFVIMKRYAEDLKTNVCSTMLEPLSDYIKDKYGCAIRYYSGRWLSYRIKDDNDKPPPIAECDVMGYAIPIATSDRTKGAQYPRVTTILLEEFMSQTATYLHDEINLFINVVSTITRSRTKTKIFLLGNAICKSSPYNTALGVKLHRMKHGEIILKSFEDEKGFVTKFAIQRTENVDVFDRPDNTEKVVYNIFGDAGVGKMIRTGEFETHSYNKIINNVCFQENSIMGDSNTLYVNSSHKLPIIIRYEDYFYRIYMVTNNNNSTLAFREIEKTSINHKNTSFIINNKEVFENITNIKSLSKFTTRNRKIDVLMDDIVMAMIQNNSLFIDDESGEDVHNAFRQSGIMIKN